MVEHIGLRPVVVLHRDDDPIPCRLVSRHAQEIRDLAEGALPGEPLRAAPGPGTSEYRVGGAQAAQPPHGQPQVIGELFPGGEPGACDLKAGGHEVVAAQAGEAGLLQPLQKRLKFRLAQLGELV